MTKTISLTNRSSTSGPPKIAPEVAAAFVFAVLLFAFFVQFGPRLFKRNRHALDRLKQAGLANERTRIKKNKIIFPTKSSSDYQANIDLLSEAIDSSIIGVFADKGDIGFRKANFGKVSFPKKPTLGEVGRDQSGQPFIVTHDSLTMNALSGSGKSNFINAALASYGLAADRESYEIAILDSQNSFATAKGIPGIIHFDVQILEQKAAALNFILGTIENIKSINLEKFETLAEAHAAGKLLQHKSVLIICDEFTANYNPKIRGPDQRLVQETIDALTFLVKTGRKYSVAVWIFFQDAHAEAMPINTSLFRQELYGGTSRSIAIARGAPELTHHLLREPGVFFYISRGVRKFVRVARVSKDDLEAIARGAK